MKTINNELRDEIIAKVIDAPEMLTNEDFELIISDPELNELYHAAVLCKEASSIENIEIPDVEEELANFKVSRKNVISVKHRWNPIVRIAAIFVGVVVTSLTAVAVFVPHTFDFILHNEQEKEIVEQTTPKNPTNAPISGDIETDIVNDKELIYDNITLETIVDELAEIYKVKVVFENETPKSLRLYVKIEQGKSAKEAVEMLSAFEQFEIALINGVIIIK
ncbi:MAG: DUF4974 domain-containing protein [Bacteroidales bacterium]|nr:DUF4974 domain-containing protein [Bacteroidales bacterium]